MSRKRKSARKSKAKPATGLPEGMPRHVFDPACECADCTSKRGKSFAYVTLVPNLPGYEGIATEGDGPGQTWIDHQRRLELLRLGVAKGRVEGRQDLHEEAAAILQAGGVATPTPPAETRPAKPAGAKPSAPQNNALPWGGPEWDELDPLLRRLLRYMHDKDCVQVADFTDAVWERGDVRPNTMHTAISRANHFLGEQNYTRLLSKPRGESIVRWV